MQMVIGHWSLVKRLRLRKGDRRKETEEKETGDRRQSERLKLFVLNIITALRTSPAGKRCLSGKNGIFSAVIEFP